MQRDLEKVEEIYAACRKRNWTAVNLLMAKEVEVLQSNELPWGGHFEGHEGVKQFWTAWSEHLDARIELDHLVDAGHHIAASGRLVGKARATQLEFEVPLVQIWTFQSGQVLRLETYTDNATLLAALGQ
jgi:ketosteroid isomerase-like protein